MVKFIHAADLHLDSPLLGLDRYEGAPVDEVRLATREALKRLVAFAIEEKVDFVVIAGDIYDGNWKDYNTGLFFVDCMRQLADAKIRVFLITGNHDAQNKMSRSLRLPDRVVQFDTRKPETIRLEDLGVSIHGFSFAEAEVAKNVALDFPAADRGMLNIGLLHTSLDSESQSGHKRYAPCSLDDLRSRGYEYWGLGHIHMRAIHCEDPWIVYPGNLQGRHIRETGAKGCVLVEAEGNRITQCKFIPLDVMRWELVSLDGKQLEDAESLYTLAKQEFAAAYARQERMPLAIRLVVEGACKAHSALARRWNDHQAELKAIATSASSGQVWLEKILLQTSEPLEEQNAPIADGAIAELSLLVHELADIDAGTEQVLDLLRELQRKLPGELAEREDGLDLANPHFGRRLLAGAHELLKDHLQRGGTP
ncbi:MAG: DNA repair exonuclease [Pirellulales bacterium]